MPGAPSEWTLAIHRNNVRTNGGAVLETSIGQLRTSTGGIQGLGKVDKIYLDNPTLIYTLASIESFVKLSLNTS